MSGGLDNSATIIELEEKIGVITVQIEDLARSVQRLQTSDFQVVTSVASKASSVSAA